MHQQKLQIDKKALFRVNCSLAMGALIMVSEFTFITAGTFFLYSWDVMEPMAYLMMLGNMTAAFGYFGFKGKELDQSSL